MFLEHSVTVSMTEMMWPVFVTETALLSEKATFSVSASEFPAPGDNIIDSFYSVHPGKGERIFYALHNLVFFCRIYLLFV